MADAGSLLLQNHLEELRNIASCKICLKPFYEPFVLGCGHTYCYGCLRSWFKGTGHRSQRSCPDCRKQVKAVPSPNYLLRDLAHRFITHAELLPEGESLEEHVKGMTEEAKLLATDKTNKGIFEGVFNRYDVTPLADFLNGIPGRLHDPLDGVDRCPLCHWELVDGQCNQCGWEDGDYEGDDFHDYDSMISDASGDSLDTEDPALIPGNRYGTPSVVRFRHNSTAGSEAGGSIVYPYSVESGEDDDEEDDEDDAHEMDDFIDDAEDDDQPGETDFEIESPPVHRLRRHYVPESDDDDEVETQSSGDNYGILARSQRQPSRTLSHSGSDESSRLAAGDDEDEAQTNYDESDVQDENDVHRLSQRPRIPRTKRWTRMIVSDDEEETDADDNEDDAEGRDGLEQFHDAEATFESDVTPSNTGRGRRVLEQSNSEDSDDTSVPPQSGVARRNRLGQRRIRRSDSGSAPPRRALETRTTRRHGNGRGRYTTTVY